MIGSQNKGHIESYNARFIIGEHFDDIINKIDIKTEKILNKIKNLKPTDAINNLRDEFIAKVNDLKDFNLRNCVINQDEFEKKWQHLIEDDKIEYATKLDQIKVGLIKNDAIILESNESIIKCSLWILNWFNNKNQIEFLRNTESFRGTFKESQANNIDKIVIRNMCILKGVNQARLANIQGIIKDFRTVYTEIFDQQLVFKLSLPGINQLKGDSFVDLKNLSEIDAKFQQIREIENFEILKSLKRLQLSVENQCGLSNYVFDNLVELESLSLTNFSLNSSVFCNLARLKRLEILECSIKDSKLIKFNDNLECLIFDDNILIGLDLSKSLFQIDNLKEFTMSGYDFNEFDPSVLKNLKMLESWAFSRNETKIIASEFPSLENLITLDLTFNQLSILRKDIFINLKSIKYLQLGCNRLTELPAGIFDSLTNLEELALNSNKLKKVERGLFRKLTNLAALFLYENDLKELDNDIFENLSQLQTLSLENNKLTKLESSDLFSKLEKLNFLNLKNNLLTSLDTKMFISLKNLRRLKISNNPIVEINDLDSLRHIIQNDLSTNVL